MKNKYIVLTIVAMVFTFTASSASAATQTCGDPAVNHGTQFVFDGVATTTIPAINNTRCDGGNPENVVSAWGTNSSVPHVIPGAIVTDEGGFSSVCPIFFFTPCSDITHTNYYRMQMGQLGAQLKAQGVTGGTFGYWIK